MFTSLRSSFFVVLILASGAGTAQTPRAMTLIDVINMPQVADPELSPDGRQVLYVESKADWKANRRIAHIWRVNADGSGMLQMTSGDGETSPRWSPDGKTIAFVARRGAEPEAGSQVFLISAARGEARPLTTHVTAVSDIAWSLDNALIYFRAADPKPEEQKAREKLKDDVFMVDEDYQQQCLWNISISTKAEHRITQSNYSVLAYQLSSDGQKVVMHRAPSPLLDDGEASEVWVMDADG